MIDPYYLSWKAREYDFHTNFIELAAETNESMPYYVAHKVIEALSEAGVCASKAKVLILGVAFKRDIADTRNSPAIKVMEILEDKVWINRNKHRSKYICKICFPKIWF